MRKIGAKHLVCRSVTAFDIHGTRGSAVSRVPSARSEVCCERSAGSSASPRRGDPHFHNVNTSSDGSRFSKRHVPVGLTWKVGSVKGRACRVDEPRRLAFGPLTNAVDLLKILSR